MQICKDLCICGAMRCYSEINPASWKQSCSSHFVNKYVNITKWQTVCHLFPPGSSSVFLLHRIQFSMFLDPLLLSSARTSCTPSGLFLTHKHKHQLGVPTDLNAHVQYTHMQGGFTRHTCMTHTHSRTVVYTHMLHQSSTVECCVKGP